MKEAMFYTEIEDQKLQCDLCPHNCIIPEDHRGICKVRINNKGKLYTEVYERVIAIHTDPIEKKPLYHFYPGSKILSIGTFGCNMKCLFCQNFDISQANPDNYSRASYVNVQRVIETAREEEQNIGIAYTYNEPTIFYEYMLDISREGKDKNLKNVMITNGYINKKPLEQLLEYMDAFNIDLKAFTDEFYKKYTKTSILPVLDSIRKVSEKGKHLELTNLIIPGLNDDEREFTDMIKWIKDNAGEDTVLHLSRYFPRYQTDIPPTPTEKMHTLYQIAKENLHHVYKGNVETDNYANTYCKKCNNLLIKRSGYRVAVIGLDRKGNCEKCNENLTKHI